MIQEVFLPILKELWWLLPMIPIGLKAFNFFKKLGA